MGIAILSSHPPSASQLSQEDNVPESYPTIHLVLVILHTPSVSAGNNVLIPAMKMQTCKTRNNTIGGTVRLGPHRPNESGVACLVVLYFNTTSNY